MLFAPSDQDESYTRQRALLEGHEAAFEDRDLLAIHLVEDGPDEAAERRRFGVEPAAFAAVLVGKDGTEKFRSHEPVRPRTLFDLIDAMPMRRREMRDRKSG